MQKFSGELHLSSSEKMKDVISYDSSDEVTAFNTFSKNKSMC